MSIINSQPLIGASGSTGYKLQRSVRLRDSASAYFNRTPAGAGSRTTWTWSGWIKRGAFYSTNSGPTIFSAGVDGNNFSDFRFLSNTSDVMDFTIVVSGSAVATIRTTQVFRDPSAWYHIVLALDTTQATSSERIKLYINGVRVTAFSTATYPAQNNAQCQVNATNVHYVGRSVESTYRYMDGYLTEVNFIDGQALTPSAFGEIDSTTGVWKPKAYNGTYGTNGFFLKFADNSGSTATTIGKDSSGNGNNWTPNNISVTTGVTYDSMLDVPTNTSTTNANFTVLNPLTAGGATITGGNLDISATANQYRLASFNLPTSGKWYFELNVNTLAATNTGMWISTPQGGVFGLPVSGAYRILKGASDISITGSGTPAAGQVMKVAYDATNGNIWFGRDTLWFSNAGNTTSDPSAGTNPSFSSLVPTADDYIQILQSGGGAGACTASINFGQRPFSYTPPTGFKSLNTYNLPDSTIPNGATQFAATTYTGTGSSLAISNTVNGKSFQPDFVWTKARSTTYNHSLVDSVRGVSKSLQSNLTNAEDNSAGAYVTAFNSDGFTVGTGTASNNSGSTYVAWQWKAGGTAVTNTAGSISSQVSANPSAGFSIVTYTGTGANATVGHGLGIAPKMVIVKRRDAVMSWAVWQTALAGTEYLLLDQTQAKATAATVWNSTTPTSTVFSIGTNQVTNLSSSATYVAYCFSEIAGFSKFGSYTGNGAADGVFVYLGFRPRWVMVKSTGVNGWVILDTSRSTYNLALAQLIPNLANAEDTTNDYFRCDILSNGFKLRTTGTPSNANGVSYIYAAFSENPFKNSLAR